MSDLGLTWDVDSFSADFSIAANDLATDDGLETAMILSLFTDRRAEDGDDLPDGETDRRGWWADAHPVIPSDRFGSRLWLLDRAKQTQETLDLAEAYAREALQWLLDDKVSDRIEITASIPRLDVLGLEVTVYKPQVDPVSYRFNYTWAAQE